MTDRYDPNDPLADIEPYQTAPPSQPGAPQGLGPGPGPAPDRSPLLTGLVLALLLVVVSIALFQLLGADGGEGTGTSAAPSDNGAATTLGPDDGDGTGTGTGTEGTTAPGEEGGDETGTTGTDGTEGAEGGPGQPYEPVGDPIPVANLQLAVDGVGEISFGTPAEAAIGRLVASLGEPESDTGVQVSDGSWGTCIGENERIVRWGPFAAIVVVDPDGTETFGAYRFDLSYGLSQPAVDMATLSGLQAGHSFRRLGQIYEGYDVTQEEDATLGPVWRLSSTNTGNLLLWGPLTAEDTVRGIYSLDACGRF